MLPTNSLESFVANSLTSRKFTVWPVSSKFGCYLEKVAIEAESSNGVLTALLYSVTGKVLRCHSDILTSTIAINTNPEIPLTVNFEGRSGNKTLSPYRGLLIREIYDLLQERYRSPNIAQGIVRSLTSSDLEIRELELSIRAYNKPESVSGIKELFDIFIASHPKGKQQEYFFAKYSLEIDISENEVITMLSGERITNNGSLGDTIYGSVVKEIVSKVALRLYRGCYIDAPSMAGITSFLIKEGVPTIKIVFKRD